MKPVNLHIKINQILTTVFSHPLYIILAEEKPVHEGHVIYDQSMRKFTKLLMNKLNYNMRKDFIRKDFK